MFEWFDLNNSFFDTGLVWYNVMGAATVGLAIINFVLYGYALKLLAGANKEITRAMYWKIAVESLMMVTVVMMGIGGMFQTDKLWWHISYVARVPILAAMPVVLMGLILAILHIINARKIVNGKGSDNND